MSSTTVKNFRATHPSIRIYDIFTFFNELDLLDIRLNILDPYVDFFVIVEADQTFSGQPKKLWFQEHQARFAKFQHKIIHYVVRETPIDWDDLRRRLKNPSLPDLDKEIIQNALTSDNVPAGVVHWLKEFYQKESIKKALVQLHDDDICFVSDVDEIWNPEVNIDFSRDNVYKLRQLVYSYYLNNRSDEPWAGTLVTKYRNIRLGCLNHLRTASKTPYTYIDHAGWHFTNQGGPESVRAKIEASYSRDDLNTPAIKKKLQERLQKNMDYVGRSFHFWVDASDLPAYITDHQQQYQQLFKKTTTPAVKQIPVTIIKIQGGLGNQLFQYALGRSLQITRNADVRFDLSWFAKQTMRKIEIDGFNIQLTPATQTDLQAIGIQPTKRGWMATIQKLIGRKPRLYVERGLPFHAEVFEQRAPTYFDGYWQSEKYFSNIASTIRREFQLRQQPNGRNASMLAEMVSQVPVTIHIRRGDYVKNAQTNLVHGTQNLTYYQIAAAYILGRHPNVIFYVFSDDLPWVRENLKINCRMVFVDQNGPDKGYEDLRIMSACKHHIIANSSFSWWGAWLAEHPGQIVIAPKVWFRSPEMDASDLVPERWLRM